ncbi:MAG: Xaa-Pro aminopeptidase [Blastocatellia bacterium]|jgi:Xaa-Pro aminopeptidase|nr:Xaa-Pro aminopeptidase [Blastocatellia bacterium]
MTRNIRYSSVFAATVFALLCLNATLPTASARRMKETPSAIRVTPPAPVIDDTKRLAELAERRARVARAIGPKAILILFSAEPRVYTKDVDYPYRQENNFYYLTNLKQKDATLVLMPGNPRMPELLFLPRRNAVAENWNGRMYSAEEARQTSGIKDIWDAEANVSRPSDAGRQFEAFIKAIRARQPYTPPAEKIFFSANPSGPAADGYAPLFEALAKNEAGLYLLGSYAPNSDTREYRQEQRLAQEFTKAPDGFTLRDAWPIFTEMRLRKSPWELALLQQAIDISIEAHQRAQVFASQAKWEYEVDAEVAHTFKLRNADNWGYPDIVGCGPNATTLHYEEAQGPVTAGSLVLMDVGAEYGHYTADVTRTFPVNGKFSKEQAEVYQIVYEAQEAAARATRPGSSLGQVHAAALSTIKDGLLKLGLITDVNAITQYRIWFMHSTSHWLGMNVHDVGGSATLDAGMVFTNEPGIYIRPDALDNLPKTEANEKFIAAVRPAFEKYKGIGVRIEDDMLVTSEGCKWLSGALPRSIADIEGFIAKARREGVR